MGRKCLVCTHPDKKKIERQIANKLPYLRIAANFNLPDKSIAAHDKNHLKPSINKAVVEKDAELKREVIETAYRAEVLLAPVEKARLMQSKLLNIYDSTPLFQEKISAARTIAVFLAEEAKLLGSYKKDGENPETLEKVVNTYNMWLRDNPDADELEKSLWVARFAEGGGVAAVDLANRVGVKVQEIGQVQ